MRGFAVFQHSLSILLVGTMVCFRVGQWVTARYIIKPDYSLRAIVRLYGGNGVTTPGSLLKAQGSCQIAVGGLGWLLMALD